MVRVMGIDPGSRKTGWGVVEFGQGRLSYVESGIVQAGDGALIERLHVIADELDRVLARLSPEHVAIESIFHHKNSQSALKLGHARGVAVLSVARANASLCELSPAEIKKAVTGNGRATKETVQRMVRTLLKTDADLGEDDSDALAAAICHSLQVG